MKRIISLRLSGEVSTKSRATRKRFHRRLIENIRDALKRESIEHSVHDNWFRIDVHSDDPKAVDVLQRVFGIQAVSLTTSLPYESMEEIVDFGETFFSENVTGKKFAVRVRRAGDREHISFESPDVERALGARLLERSAGVDLDNPDFRAQVEVRKDLALFFHEERLGSNGLPTGCEGRALVLISGGFDSSVAAWKVLSRGVDVDFVFFNLGGPEPLRHTVRAVRRLVEKWAFGHSPKLHVVDFRPLVAEMKKSAPQKFWQVLLKRFMYQGAEHLAEILARHHVLVTGEAIGQVSSQTLSNLNTIARAIEMPVLRPLIASHKQEIIETAFRIGTHTQDVAVPEFCDLAGGKVATETKVAEVTPYHTDETADILTQVVEQRRVWTVRKIKDEEIVREVRIDHVPDGAIVLDLRESRRQSVDPIEGAISIGFDTALEQAKMLPKTATYVVVCELGLKSAYVAEVMQRMGFDAHALTRA